MTMKKSDISGKVSLATAVSLLLLFSVVFRLGYACLNGQTALKQRPTAIVEQLSKATPETGDDQGFEAVLCQPLIVEGHPGYQLLLSRETGTCGVVAVSRLSARAPPLSVVSLS